MINTQATQEATIGEYAVLRRESRSYTHNRLEFTRYEIWKGERSEGDVTIDWGLSFVDEVQKREPIIGWFSTRTNEADYARALAKALELASKEMEQA